MSEDTKVNEILIQLNALAGLGGTMAALGPNVEKIANAATAIIRDLAALPDATPSPVDNPDADATDAAHPAWWRGHDQGVWSTCELLTKTLDGVAGGVCREPLETVRRRIAALSFGVPAELMEAAKALDNFAWSCVQCDNNEAQRYLSELRENLRSALARQHPSPPSAAATEFAEKNNKGEH